MQWISGRRRSRLRAARASATAVFFVYLVRAPIDPLAQVFEGEGVVAFGVEDGLDGALDPARSPAQKCYYTGTLRPYPNT